jgi:hypothetical protein
MLIQLATALAIPTAASAAPPAPAAVPAPMAAPAAPAQVAAPPLQPSQDQEQIIVQGVRVNKQQVRDFIRAVTEAPYEGQLGRFHAAACPVAMGLTDVQNARIAVRMRQVASAAGIRVASASCAPNIFVIVAADKRAALDELDRRFPMYFNGMSSKAVNALKASTAPAVAWQVSSRLSADGLPLEKPLGADYYRVSGTENPSRIRSATEPTFLASVVVIDLKAAGGLTTTELADYAAMRTFAATDPERITKTGAPTILGVLAQPDDKLLPVTLTYWDLAFLKSLYATDNAYYARYQRGDMERVIQEELQRSRSIPRDE